jgi:hypothetical protein
MVEPTLIGRTLEGRPAAATGDEEKSTEAKTDLNAALPVRLSGPPRSTRLGRRKSLFDERTGRLPLIPQRILRSSNRALPGNVRAHFEMNRPAAPLRC